MTAGSDEPRLRIICLDPGAKRVGVALSDGLGLTGQPLCVLDRKPNHRFLSSLAGLVEEHGAGRIIIGLPRNMNGSLGPEAQKAMSLAAWLRKELAVQVETWDERLSSAAVDRMLTEEADLSRGRRREVRDKVAAAYILQSYLDAQRG